MLYPLSYGGVARILPNGVSCSVSAEPGLQCAIVSPECEWPRRPRGHFRDGRDALLVQLAVRRRRNAANPARPAPSSMRAPGSGAPFVGGGAIAKLVVMFKR